MPNYRITLYIVALFSSLFPTSVLSDTPDAYGRIHLTLDGIAYVIEGSIISTSQGGFSKTVAEFPPTTMSLLLNYFPDLPKVYGFNPLDSKSMYHADDCHVSSACTFQGRIWVGFSRHSSEGYIGIGGIGYWEPKSNQIGILRHPSVLNMTVEDISVTSDTIFAKTTLD